MRKTILSALIAATALTSAPALAHRDRDHRHFRDHRYERYDDDYRRYRRYRQYAIKVYPYAVQAIRIFRETEYAMNNLSNRESKRYIRRLQRELKDEFADPLKNLSKTQGLILIKMIERELDTPMYDLIKDLRGGITASYWNTMGKLFGHSIKDGYIDGEDRILDAVLDDFNVSYDVPETRN